MNKEANLSRTYLMPMIGGLVVSALAIQWAFMLDSWGQVFNRETLSGFSCAWIILVVIDLVNKRWRRSLAWLAIPGVYVLVLSLCRLSVAGQVEEARLRGEEIIKRAIHFSEATGTFPKTLEAIVEFDGKPIPKTGIRKWGSEDRNFYLGSYPGTSIAFDNYLGAPFYSESPYKTEFWIGFREYGFQEHKLRPDAEWDTDSGKGDYLVGNVDLRWW